MMNGRESEADLELKPKVSVEEMLREINSLHRKGIVSDAEYTELRKMLTARRIEQEVSAKLRSAKRV